MRSFPSLVKKYREIITTRFTDEEVFVAKPLGFGMGGNAGVASRL